MKPSKNAHSSTDIRLRAKLTSHAEMILKHRRPRRGIRFGNTTQGLLPRPFWLRGHWPERAARAHALPFRP